MTQQYHSVIVVGAIGAICGMLLYIMLPAQDTSLLLLLLAGALLGTVIGGLSRLVNRRKASLHGEGTE